MIADANTDVAGTQPVLTTEWSTGSAQKGMGTWDVDFYGGNNSTEDNQDTAQNTALPLAATGEFSAHIGGDGTTNSGAVGRLQGAFGVNKMDP